MTALVNHHKTPPTWPEHAMTASERKALRRDEQHIVQQSALVTRIHASTIGIHTEPTPRQINARRIRRQRAIRRLCIGATYSALGTGIVLIAIGYANLIGVIYYGK